MCKRSCKFLCFVDATKCQNISNFSGSTQIIPVFLFEPVFLKIFSKYFQSNVNECQRLMFIRISQIKVISFTTIFIFNYFLTPNRKHPSLKEFALFITRNFSTIDISERSVVKNIQKFRKYFGKFASIHDIFGVNSCVQSWCLRFVRWQRNETKT